MSDHPVCAEQPKKRRHIILWVVGIFVALVCIYALWRIIADKPAVLVQTDDINAPINVKTREVPDFRYLYNIRQERAINPVEENGWQALLASYGPLALEQTDIARRIPWEEFPTHEESKNWYATKWTPICEKMGVDPAARPVFFQRLNMFDTLIKYGVTGQEGEKTENPEGDAQDPSESIVPQEVGFYYEDCQKHDGVISLQAAEDTYNDLLSRPWTDADSPVMAKWLEENADQYDVIAAAARQPRMQCWHITPEFPHTAIETLLPDVQSLRNFSRMVLIRANYRIGTGDFAEAMDDFETVLAISNSPLRSDTAFLVETLVGFAVSSTAFSVNFHANPDAPLGSELSARYIALVRQYASDEVFEDAFEAALAMERAMSTSVVSDMLRARRSISGSNIIMNMTSDFIPQDQKSVAGSLFDYIFFLYPENDAKVLARYQMLLDSMGSGAPTIAEAAKNGRKLDKPTEKLLQRLVVLLQPAYEAMYQAKNERLVQTRLAIITEALLAYQEEHGTLPPAFSVDADGKPLHSWRVLVLPYLGEQERALYEQIHLDEPWDSEYNREFFAQMPSVYRGNVAPNMPADRTPFTVLLGEEQFFDDSGVGKDWREIMKREDRNASAQGILFERKKSICWMQPDAELQVAELVANFPEDPHEYRPPFIDRVVTDLDPVVDLLRERRGGYLFGRAIGGQRFISNIRPTREYDEILRGRPQPKEE